MDDIKATMDAYRTKLEEINQQLKEAASPRLNPDERLAKLHHMKPLWEALDLLAAELEKYPSVEI